MGDKKNKSTEERINGQNTGNCAAYTYMVRCKDGSLYTGWTNHLEQRVRAHNEGKGAKYTRSRGPVELVYAEEHETRQEAMSREARIKLFTKKEKEELVKIYQEEQMNIKKQKRKSDMKENSEKI